MFRMPLGLLLSLHLLSGFVAAQTPVSYDIVYVRASRAGNTTRIAMPEVKDPINMEPGADLMLLHPNGSEELLVAGGNGAVVDPVLSFDGQWVYYARFHDLRDSALNYQRRYASTAGSDIYKINLQTKQVVQLTVQEWTPNTAAANWSSDHLRASAGGTFYLGYGIFNLGPCPLPGGRVMFSSSRNGFLPTKDYTFPNLQLFVMDEDGRNVDQIGHLNLGSALHPSILKDGRVMFASYESQGLRDSRIWGLWSIWPDGRGWGPLMSGFTDAASFHFQTQLSNEHIAVVEYYNQNNNGFGTLLAFPPSPPNGTPWFGDPRPSHSSNPAVRRGIWWFDPSHEAHLRPRYKQYPFSPYGLYALSGFTHGEDEASSRATDGTWAGKVTHPSGAPSNDVLLTWSPGPANDLDRPTSVPTYDAGIYLIRGGTPVNNHRDLVLVKNSPNYNEIQPRAVVPYRQIYGVDEPARLSWLPNDGRETAELPAGTPFGLVGTASFYKRNVKPGIGSSRFAGLDSFNTSENGESSNWSTQGAEAGRYTDADLYAVRILAMEPTSHRSYGPAEGSGFSNHANERLRILGEIPLRKVDGSGNPLRDGDGNPDTSFLAKIPADTSFTFQTLDKDGLVLNMSQTWHQVRPGEVRKDCGGCHAHAQLPADFGATAAARADYRVHDLTKSTSLLTKDEQGNPVFTQRTGVLDVEYYRDIKPILRRSCIQCHSTSGRQEARLVLDDETLRNGVENTYNRLADDSEARYGIAPVIPSRTWRQTNASRYVRMFQSRRSLLVWKVFGRRLDGWTNADFPTESVPGNAGTLPAGANPNEADLDFTGTACPPPSSGAPPLSEDEKILFARWIDLGAPISSPDSDYRGWFQDDLRPTLTLSLPRAGANSEPLDLIRLGAFDYYSGLDRASLSVKANFAVNGRAAGTELATLLAEAGDHIWTMPVIPKITNLKDAVITVTVRDTQGNITRIERSFSIGSTTPAGPAVSAVYPSSGPTTGNTWLRIMGSSFPAGSVVRIGGADASDETLVSSGELAARTAAQAAGTYDVTVTLPDGTVLTLPQAFTYRALTAVTPRQPGTGSTLPAWRIPYVVDSESFRTNLGINNLAAGNANVSVSLVDNNGLLVAKKTIAVPPYGMKQINNVARFLEDSAGVNGREGYLILEADQDIRAWASHIDNVTADPSLELARADASSRILLPSSVSSDRFATSLMVLNTSPAGGMVNIRLRNIMGQVQASLLNQAVAANGYLYFEDLYRKAGVTGSYGPVEIEGLNGLRLMAVARIYSSEHTSSYFEAIEVAAASRNLVLPYAVDSAQFRSNLGINNPGSVQANVTVTLTDSTGARLGSLPVTVPSQGLTQINNVVQWLLGSPGIANKEGSLRIEADQDVLAWTSQIDNLTQDPSLVVSKPLQPGKLLVPSATRVGSFTSSLVVVNPGSSAQMVEFRFRDVDGNVKSSGQELLPAGGFLNSNDILARLGVTADFGPLEIVSLSGRPLLAASRVYSQQRTGGYFEGVP